MKRAIKIILTWIWCFPQMLIGLIVKIVTGATKVGDHYRYNIESGSVSLGTFIFLCPSHWGDEKVLKHEKGHTIQSYYLGWLYLIVIALPSLIWCGCFDKYRKKHGISYYSFYTEKWANKLMGISDD